MNYLKGLENEILVKPILEKYFKLDLIHNDRYALFDFVSTNDNNYIDLMMNLNKWNEGYKYMNFDKNVYYVFKFIDGLYYYQQNFTDNFEIREQYEKKYIYIPTNKLTKINNN